MHIEKTAPKPAPPTNTNLPLPTSATRKQEELKPLHDTLVACISPIALSHPKLYPQFIETLCRELIDPLEASDIRKLSSVINAMVSEKQKREKDALAKGKGAKSNIDRT